MSIASKGLSAIGKLASLGVLLAAFMLGMAGVVYMSLSGSEMKVPEIVGKDYFESERELGALGLKIKRRAERPSAEKINTVLEQLPKPGETVKTGQMILVVVSKAGVEGEAPPPPVQDFDTDDSEKIEEMISEKPKKSRSNSNSSKKKAETTRDTIANVSDSNTATSSETGGDDDKKREPGPASPSDKNRNTSTGPAVRPQGTPAPVKPAPRRTSSGEPRPGQ